MSNNIQKIKNLKSIANEKIHSICLIGLVIGASDVKPAGNGKKFYFDFTLRDTVDDKVNVAVVCCIREKLNSLRSEIICPSKQSNFNIFFLYTANIFIGVSLLKAF